MAVESPNTVVLTYIAGADLSSSQFLAVKAGATVGQVVLCTAATDRAIGVLQNKPKSGQEAAVMVLGVTKWVANAGLSVDNGLTLGATTNAPRCVAATPTPPNGASYGRVLVANSAAGGYVTALVNFINS